jgi:hypothetical protein
MPDGLRVKALEWESDPRWKGTLWAHGYQLNDQGGGEWLMTTPEGNDAVCSTLEAAKAAAQADYAARILAALEDTGEPALIREAEARGLERAAQIAAESAADAKEDPGTGWASHSWLMTVCRILEAEAAALRKDEETPK